ncbi:MAG TPA: cytochrome c biogenesis protein CcdA, partial [Chitinivibrionales bacterium]
EPLPSLTITPLVSKDSYAPGDTVLVALQISIPKHYHLFDNPKGPGFGTPMTYAMRGPEQIEWIELLKTKSKKINADVGGWFYGFEGNVCFFLRGKIKTDAVPGAYTAALTVGGLICYSACYPVDKNVDIAFQIVPSPLKVSHFENSSFLPKLLRQAVLKQALESQKQSVATAAAPALKFALNGLNDSARDKGYEWKYSPQEARSDFSIWLAILLGFLAGIILNAMPCVLPVLGVKIMSFAQTSGQDRRNAIMHSVFFSMGVMLVFFALASLAAFANFSWGGQFQDPRALAAIITLIVIFSLGMFDVYMLTVPKSIANANRRNRCGMLGDFFNGIFATILATPCSGPFLGAVLAWSITQPAWIIFIVYSSIGAGMSFPYVILSSSKRLAGLLPKPGAWMNDFKKIMGFLLLGFAVYLMLGLPTDMVVPTALFCVLLSLAVSAYSRISPWGSSIRRMVLSVLCSLLTAAGAFYVSYMIVYPSISAAKIETIDGQNQVWVEFNADSLTNAHKRGRSVLVDFTANWCMNCQYNYIMVLSKKEITDLIRQKNVLALKADMTSASPVQDSLLHALGSRSIPFLALFPGADPYKPVIMRDVLTKGRVKKALSKL